MAPKNSTALLKQFRDLMQNKTYVAQPIQAYIVLSEDAHQNEYCADRDNRRAFISGFSGSAGTVVITDQHACLWTDGRYFLQASQELDENWTLMKQGLPETPTMSEWLRKVFPDGAKVGFDPMTMSFKQCEELEGQLYKYDSKLVPVNRNLVDLIWPDQPPLPSNLVIPLELNYTGATSQSKVEKVRVKMEEKGVSALLVAALDEIAWLLNLRGSDIAFNPVFFAYVLIMPTEVHVFIDEKKVTSTVREHLQNEKLNVTWHPYENVQSFFSDVVKLNETNKDKIWVPRSSSYAFGSIVRPKQLIIDASPIAEMKAVKNQVEIEGLKNAHIKDGAALCAYFAWLEKEVAKGNTDLTEIYAEEKLEKFRMKQEDYVGLSFATISSSGPNGAIIHYKATPETDRLITRDEMYLCDSGGQFKDGTTDVTRTMHFGTPSEYEKECFTRVLKGQIFLGTAAFPEKIKGNVLDILGRKNLWDVGLNYMHGTGHGIGAFLNVHEGPMGISWREMPDDPGLQEGMFLSNEPGYYEEGKFGIRLENIVRVVATETNYTMKGLKFLTFEDVTYVPIQTKLMLPSLLTKKEISYLNDYHTQCREKVGPLLKQQGEVDGLAWLMRETEPIG